MAYGKLAEGDRIWDSSKDLGIYFEDFNEINDQLKAMLGPLTVAVPMASAEWDKSGAVDYYYRKALGWWAWQSVNAAAIVFPLGTLRTGQVITAIDVTTRGAAVGGGIILYRQPIATPAAPTSTGTWAANPFNTGGADQTKSATGGLPHTVLTDFEYYIEITTSAGAQYIHGIEYTVQFGA